MNDYKPRPEVIAFLKETMAGADTSQDILIRVSPEGSEIMNIDWVKEVENETEIGIQMYGICELSYDALQAAEQGEPLDPAAMESAMKELIKQYFPPKSE